MKQKIVMNIGGKFRRAKLEGRDHLVVPCVMLVTGVINGSAGPLFYPEDEIEKSASKWNGMPIVVDHPTDGEDFISARSAEVFNSRKVGVILETEFDDKLRTECWFDEERTKAVDKRVHNAILKKKKMEVSTGLELDNVEKEGEYEGTKYSGITSNYRPDHLAILPDKIGAASISMGAGLFANVSKEPESIQEVWNRSIENALKPLGITITANEMSFSDISRALSDLLSSQYGEPGKYWQGWVCDVYDEYVIFCSGNNGETWRQVYTNKDDVVALSGDAVQVRRTISYTANVSNSGSSKMAFDKKKFVDNLIANGDAAESDRDKLMGVDDTILALWEVSNPKPPKIKKVTDVEPEPAPAPVVNKKTETEEEVIAKLPKRLRKILVNHEKAETAHREQLIEVITNQKLKKPFKKEWLEGQETEVLENMVQMIPVANASPDDDDGDDEDEDGSIVFGRAAGGNYVGNAGGGSKVTKEDEDKGMLEPVGVVNFADPRKKR